MEEILGYASEELKSDRNFILEAVKINEKLLEYASLELQNDFDFLVKCYEVNKEVIKLKNI